jgi:hypothetical protein
VRRYQDTIREQGVGNCDLSSHLVHVGDELLKEAKTQQRFAASKLDVHAVEVVIAARLEHSVDGQARNRQRHASW